MVFDWLKSLMGRGASVEMPDQASGHAPGQAASDGALQVDGQTATASDDDSTSPDDVITPDDPRIEEGHTRMHSAWSKLGQVDEDVISYLINPGFAGAPMWPNTRQAYRVVRTEKSLILASDGLSDPFVGTDMVDVSGFELEVYVEVESAQGWTQEEIMNSAAFDMVQLTAQNMANHGGVARLLKKYELLSMALPVATPPDANWQDEDGMVGILLGVPAPDRPSMVDLPLGPVTLVPLTPLRPDELAYAAKSSEARAALTSALLEGPSAHRFNSERPSVMPGLKR